MRWLVAIALVGCQFEHGGAGTDGGVTGVTVDAAPLPCANKRVWAADFSIDPTTLNANGDPVVDWRIREGGALPGQLVDGVWSVAATPTVSLDTQPKQDFNRRTRATARMRNTSGTGTSGVILALDVDYSPMTYMPLFIEVRLDANSEHQTATLFAKTAISPVVMATFPGLGTGMIDVSLDVDPMMNTVTVRVGNDSATYPYLPIARNMNDDRFATLAYSSDGEFDEVLIETCL